MQRAIKTVVQHTKKSNLLFLPKALLFLLIRITVLHSSVFFDNVFFSSHITLFHLPKVTFHKIYCWNFSCSWLFLFAAISLFRLSIPLPGNDWLCGLPTHSLPSPTKERIDEPQIPGFPGGSEGKESACKAGEIASVPGSRRSPGKGHSNPLQYSCLENLMDREGWWAN